jgi:Aminotransferase class I and II
MRSFNKTNVYIGTPAWGNYIPLFQHTGFSIQTYVHYDRGTCKIDFTAALDAVMNAPDRSIFVFQACCHNPTGQDYDQLQWRQLAAAIQRRQHFVFFDIAYQGFASDMDNDASSFCRPGYRYARVPVFLQAHGALFRTRWRATHRLPVPAHSQPRRRSAKVVDTVGSLLHAGVRCKARSHHPPRQRSLRSLS